MKTLDADSLYKGVHELDLILSSFTDQLRQIQSSINELVSLEDSLKGKGGTSIRAFFQDCHEPFLTFCISCLTNYGNTLKNFESALKSLDASPNAFIRQSFLENELTNGLRKVKGNTIELTQDANQSMQSVSDIVFLPRLNELEFVNQVEEANRSSIQTIEKLVEFDLMQTNALSSIEQQILKMNQFIEQIHSMFQSGQLSLASYKPGQLWSQNKAKVGNGNSKSKESKLKNPVKDKELEWWELEYTNGDSSTVFDLSAPVSSTGNKFSTGTEAVSYYNTAINTQVKGFGIKKDGDVFRVKNGNVVNIKGKRYHSKWIDSQLKRGNIPEIAKNVKPSSALKSSVRGGLAWVGVGITTTENAYENIQNNESTSKIVGDAGVDVGLGAVTLGLGSATAAFVVGTVGAPVLAGATVGLAVSIGVSYILEGIKTGKGQKNISDKIKDKVQKSVKTIANWFS
ncbi:LXG domain-containing protein [Fictibacillus sp. 5RED26]|uniref:LXG domain-containing protein n=1 Tax=Fictibacillus sp. 5RED26 TaxID=2745876 RepID=UPI0018CE4233|nr:LXG domain-containing protein [Fictibacillus sp. 5RED26]MBH0156278.1 LXG domain-containing protein [Fictibacillus sp. 5RED26]